MTNKELCRVFVNGAKKGLKGNSMHIDSSGSKLFSYGTMIAQRLKDGTIVVNETKYSPTTFRHQYYLRCALCDSGVKTISTIKAVPYWCNDGLTHYC